MQLTHLLTHRFAHFISPHLASRPGIMGTGYRTAILTSLFFSFATGKTGGKYFTWSNVAQSHTCKCKDEPLYNISQNDLYLKCNSLKK